MCLLGAQRHLIQCHENRNLCVWNHLQGPTAKVRLSVLGFCFVVCLSFKSQAAAGMIKYLLSSSQYVILGEKKVMDSILCSGISHFYPVTYLIQNTQSRAEPKIVSKLDPAALHPDAVIHWLLHKEKCVMCLKMQVAMAVPYATCFFCVCIWISHGQISGPQQTEIVNQMLSTRLLCRLGADT